MARRRKYTEDEELQILESINTQTHNHTLKNTKIELKHKNKNQKLFSDYIEQKEVVICSGPAGTGKTYVACAQALKLFKTDNRYKRI